MGLLERKERERNELRELILVKAKEIMIKDGQEKLSIRKIASEIEYSPATIYLYFKDKDEILYQMMQMGFEIMANEMSEVFQETNPIKRVHLIGKKYLQFSKDHPDWYDLMFKSDAPMKHIERCKAEWGPGLVIFELLVSTCNEAFHEQGMTGLEPRITALNLWSNVHGLACFAQSHRLCVVSNDYTTEYDDKLMNQALENLLLSTFNYKQ